MKQPLKILNLFLALQFAVPPAAFAQLWSPQAKDYEYLSGPQKDTAMGKEILKLYAELPEFRYLSDMLTPKQKFRYTFGSMPLRINFAPNTIKIMAIGQDAVDDAELGHLPGIGTGYSTRVQSIAEHHGVSQSLGTSNASAQTIKGQYGSFKHFFVEMDKNGQPQLRQSKFVDNFLWNMFNGRDSIFRKDREKKWEWVIRNNPESLKLFILYGGASQDGFAEFLISNGFRVKTKMDPERLKNIQLPESTLVFGGGNNEFPVLLTPDGKDLYAELLKRTPDYTKSKKINNEDVMVDQEAAMEAVKKAGPQAIERMTFTGGGLYNSGIINAAQLGGYDLENVEVKINGVWTKTNSLKGLQFSDGYTIKEDIFFAPSQHPTSLSKNIAEASQKVQEIFKNINVRIEPDLDRNGQPLVSNFSMRRPYQYGRGTLPRRVFPFGTPDSIRLPEQSADRLGPQVLVAEPPPKKVLASLGYRNLEDIFDKDELEAAKQSLPATPLNPNDIFSGRPRQPDTFDQYDEGPGEEIAKLISDNLDQKIFEPKENMKIETPKGSIITDLTLHTHGIAAYNVKSHPSLGFFAHYRGTFENAEALILHDPFDLEDRNTYMAATGKRGQYLNGLMHDLGIGDSHLVIKTVPVDMHGATAEEWEAVRSQTETYREVLIKKALSTGKVKIVFADGPVAKFEIQRIFNKMKINLPVVNIDRKDRDASAGFAEAAKSAQLLGKNKSASLKPRMLAISPSHLPFIIRGFEANGGGTVVESNVKQFKGKVYAIVAPNFVANQKVIPRAATIKSVEESLAVFENNGLRGPKESIQKFLARTGRSGKFSPEGLKSGKTDAKSLPEAGKNQAEVNSCVGVFKK